MSAREFEEWKAEYRIEPFGDDWLQAGTIAAAAVAPYSRRKVKPEDFVPEIKRPMTPEEEQKVLDRWARKHNEMVRRQEQRLSPPSAKSTPSSQPPPSH